MNVTRTQAIKAFLTERTIPDLALIYNHDMECQVNVAQDNGDRIEGDYHGRQWHGWTDGLQVWKSFRIPYNANLCPEYDDRVQSFDLTSHAEGIGMTGWDWKSKVSKWVAFDFDAITGHSDKNPNKLTSDQLKEIQDAAFSIPWVTIRRSTSGKGLHFYVFLENVQTDNHNEHAALARSILGLMSGSANFDFTSRVDVCGGNMWVWHRKMSGTNGLEVIKQGTVLKDVSSNWKDHILVISGKRKKILPSFVEDENKFEEIVGQRTRVKLDTEHQALIKFLDDSGASFWWSQDHGMLVAHTWDLMQAHENLKMKGIFKTISTGREHGHDHNCYLFPMRKGAWVVRRFTPGISEDNSWDQDNNGWTRCFLNQEPDLKVAARANAGLEDDGNKFVFRYASEAQATILSLGADINVPAKYQGRKTVIKQHKDGKRLVIELTREDHDSQDDLKDWLPVKGYWRKIISVQKPATAESDIDSYDDLVRHLVTSDTSDCGWVIKSDESWHEEPLAHVKTALESLGIKTGEIKSIIGGCVFKPWKLVNRPFHLEYPGNREWNRNAAQFRFAPSTDSRIYPTWLRILTHVGESLNEAVTSNTWAQANGLVTGADYLKCWISSLFQHPEEPLPYLFLYGPQASGKSIFHEALNLLITSGCVRADHALTSTSGFNAELENAILCIVEETDLKHNKQAYNKIKDWVTSISLPIRKLFTNLYSVNNTTHYCQCANDRSACPVFPGDTRITMVFVDALKETISKRELFILLEKEAPDFLAEILHLELPRSNDRLNIPILETSDKVIATQANQTLLEAFIDEKCFSVDGESMLFSEFYDEFIKWLEPNDRYDWSKIKVGRAMPGRFPKGRNASNAQWIFGNISFVQCEPQKPKFVLKGDKLIHEIQIHTDTNL